MENSELKKPWGMEVDKYCMWMHIAQVADYVLIGTGTIAVLIMWLAKRKEYPEVNQHGKIIVNWIFSLIIYVVIILIPIILSYVGPFFGYFGFFDYSLIGVFINILRIAGFVFAIIGAVKAHEGKFWYYPMSIRFFKP